MSKKSRTRNLLSDIRSFLLYTEEQYITKEDLARKYKARQHEVAHVLHKLNLEGLVEQPIHHAHCGDPWDGVHRCNAYLPDLYKIIK